VIQAVNNAANTRKDNGQTYVTGSVKRDLNSLFKCAYFNEAYFHNAKRNLNQTWVFYGGGIAAAMIRK